MPLVAAALPVALAACERFAHAQSVKLDTEFQAVFPSNGQVFFGRLENVDQPCPRLRGVCYLQTRVDPQSQKVSGVPLKRGSELHAPDLIVLNSRQILAIESVGRESRGALLIAESHKQQAGGAGAVSAPSEAQPASPAPK